VGRGRYEGTVGQFLTEVGSWGERGRGALRNRTNDSKISGKKRWGRPKQPKLFRRKKKRKSKKGKRLL